MSLLEYNLMQVRYIRCYGRHLGVDAETASWLWVSGNLAVKFSELYREE